MAEQTTSERISGILESIRSTQMGDSGDRFIQDMRRLEDKKAEIRREFHELMLRHGVPVFNR